MLSENCLKDLFLIFTYLEILYYEVVISVFAFDYFLQIQSHFLKLISKSFKAINFFLNSFAKLTLTCIFDITEEMLDTDFLSLSGAYGCWSMHELTVDISIAISFLLGEVCFRG